MPARPDLQESVDVLAVGAHPDDVEVGIGGLVRKLAHRGVRVGILDLTEGELATRGSVEERRNEAREAARLLGVSRRANAGLPDGGLTNTKEMQAVVISHLRAFHPRVLIASLDNDRHPDHEAAHALVRDANYFAGLRRIDTGQQPHRAGVVYYYRVYGETTPPTFVVDITDTFDEKLAALRAYASQLHNPTYPGEATYVSSRGLWEAIQSRAAYWGSRIGVAYGEPLYAQTPVGLDLPPGLEIV